MNLQDIVGDVLRQKLAGQKWYQTYVNGVIVAVTLAVGLLWTGVSLGFEINPDIIASVFVVIQGLGLTGVKMSTNGVTPKQIEDLEKYVGKHRQIDKLE